jgi:hypothetical protein
MALSGVPLRGIADLTRRGLRQPGVPSMFDGLEVKVLYPTGSK